MSVSVSAVESSNPDALTAASDQLGTKIIQLDAVLAEQRRALDELEASWQGQASSAAIARGEANLREQTALRGRLQAVQAALRSGGSQLSSARDAVLTVVDGLRAVGWQVTDDGTATPPPWFPAHLAIMAAPFTAIIRRLLELFDTIDQQTAAAIRAATGTVPPSAPGASPASADIPAPGTPAGDVNAWWTSLSPEQRQRLIAAHPPELGNLNGIPAGVRDQVNQAVMTDDLARVSDVARRNGVSTDDVVHDPVRFGLATVDATRYTNAVQAKRGLDHQRGGDAGDPNVRPVMLWAYQPLADGGQGRAAVAIGNPDTAQNTAVVVPGTGSSLRDGWLSDGHDDGIHLYEQSRLGNPDEQTAVISWMGYDAPDSFTDPRIATPWLAREGGDLLAADVNGLSATHLGTSHVTVIGHSYGSTTVADAFAGGDMRANDAVLIGSPGTDLATSAADFHLDGGRVYVGAASTDPVSWFGTPGAVATNLLNQELGSPFGPLAGLGTDPAGDAYGSVRFHAEVAGSDELNVSDHSHYYDSGSESLRAMVDIASGNADRLDDAGPLAEGRHQPRISTPDHVDIPFVGTVPIPHLDTDIPGSPAIIDDEADRPGSSVTTDHSYRPND
ncbi:alpha/beta hydrolase [Mycolicibacterium sp.]|uniref:alpha/beta hydrolase n=1 Tax=Mycolicibacterium sp. TaxID=2320850 RepID=UPI001A34C1B0|nr:alpha/beta hydrolase [Mycolicibacterium sp.]MBJ7339298.1 alpha/beta hydrolase [Mycolicibacterium sp.]